MLQTATNTVCSKSKYFNRPWAISLFSLVFEMMPSKTRTRLPIVSTAPSWVYPSFSSSLHGRNGWDPIASLLAGTLLLLHPGSLFPSYPGAWVTLMAAWVVVACVWGRGVMPATSVVPSQHTIPPGLVSAGPTVCSSPCHTLLFGLVMVSHLPLGISLVFHAWGIPRKCLPANLPPCVWQLMCVFLSCCILRFPCFHSRLFTVGVESFSYRLHGCGGFWVCCMQACTLFCSFYP